MAEPQKYLLLIAYLSARVREEKGNGSFQDLVPRWGVSKQVLVKLARYRTIGFDVFVRIAEARHGGSMDAILSEASLWWRTKLTDVERAEILAWSRGKHDARTAHKRTQSAEDRAEVRRLEKADVALRKTPPVSSTPPSGAHRHARPIRGD